MSRGLIVPLGLVLLAALASQTESNDWEVAGRAMTSCSCRTPCPCRSNRPPSPNHFCESSEFAVFDAGHYGGASLASVAFVMTQRLFAPDGWLILYIDKKASKTKRDVLISLLRELGYGEFRAIKLVEIQFSEKSDTLGYEVEIPSVLELMSEKLVDGTGKPFPVRPVIDIWGDTIFYAANSVHRYRDSELGVGWNWSGCQSNHKTFSTSRADYERGKIGWGLYDGSGTCRSCAGGSDPGGKGTWSRWR